MRYLIGSMGDQERPEDSFLILPVDEILRIHRSKFSYDVVDKNEVLFSCTHITFIESTGSVSEISIQGDQDPNLLLRGTCPHGVASMLYGECDCARLQRQEKR